MNSPFCFIDLCLHSSAITTPTLLPCMLHHSVMFNSLQPHGLKPARLHCPWNFPGKNTGMGCHFLLQGIFLTQRSNPCLLDWQVDSLSLCHLGSPKYNVSYRFFRFISIKLRQLLSIPTLLVTLVMNSYWIFPNAFSASVDVIIWFFFFNLLIWWIILIDSQILN